MTDFDYTIVYDTYCGWSYGAAEALRELTASDARVQVLHRYLFQGDNAPLLADGYSEHMETADRRISELSGAEYSNTYASAVRNSPTEVLESGLSADAATLVQELGPTAELELSRRLQHRRFVDGVSAQDRSDIVEVLVEFGVDRDAAEQVGQPELRAQTQQTAARATTAMSEAGAVGVPAVIAHRNNGDHVIDLGPFYRNPAAATAALHEVETA